jgi:putative DNA primase/helicase
MAVTRQFLGDKATHSLDFLTLAAWRGGVWRWSGTCWREAEPASVKKMLYAYTDGAVYLTEQDFAEWSPTRHKIADLLDAVQASTHVDQAKTMPGWLYKPGDVPARELVACNNGLLHVPTRDLLDHTPNYWNTVSVPFDYDAEAPEPAAWYRFLEDLWPSDPESVTALRQWFGYVISGRTDLQKIMLLVGPTRSGKGVICRVLEALLGAGNHCGPTLSAFAQNFGLSPLIGKPLAVVSDARLSGNSRPVVERLLSISGEDLLTVDRKYREPWTGTFPTRIMIVSNELPLLGDASAAVVGRFIIVQTTRSFLGREDTGLTKTLMGEMPGILNWALDGLAQVGAQGMLSEPPTSSAVKISMVDLASPVSAFVRQCCDTSDPNAEMLVDDLWMAWTAWAESQNVQRGNKIGFGRNLRAARPGLKHTSPGGGPTRYVGVRLHPESIGNDPSHPSQAARERDEMDEPQCLPTEGGAR